MTTLIPKFQQTGTGAVNRAINLKLAESVSILDFGADPTGVADSSAAIQAAFSSGKSVYFPDGSYLMSSGVTLTQDNIFINFGNATIINNETGGYLFTFGTTADTPQNTGLTLTGGTFNQANTSDATASNFIYVKAIKNVKISNMSLNNVGNGGLHFQSGSEDISIDSVTIIGKSGYSTTRGIWFEGAFASDYALQLMDVSSMTRNATPYPVYAVKNVKVTNCTIVGTGYGIYLMNCRKVTLTNNYIDISGSGLRCIAVNNYSPNTIISNNEFIGDDSSTGILVTQYSNNVTISNNVWNGTFSGGRDIQIEFGATALILNNQFNTTSTYNIQIDVAGNAVIKNNIFNRPTYTAGTHVVDIQPCVQSYISGSYPTLGQTATLVSEVIFESNVIYNMSSGIYADTRTVPASNGNLPGLAYINCKNNLAYYGTITPSISQALFYADTPASSSNISEFNYTLNDILPLANADMNFIRVGIAATANVANNQIYSASFSVSVATAGGAITTAKNTGNNFSLTVTRTGTNLLLAPRSASAIPQVYIIDSGGTIYRYSMVRTGNNFVLTCYDSADVAINASTTALSFEVIITGLGTV